MARAESRGGAGAWRKRDEELQAKAMERLRGGRRGGVFRVDERGIAAALPSCA